MTVNNDYSVELQTASPEQLRARVAYLEAQLEKTGEARNALAADLERIRLAVPENGIARRPQDVVGDVAAILRQVRDDRLGRTLSPGIAAIAAERRRQVEQEGWTPGHDDEHDGGELALAACAYTIGATPADALGDSDYLVTTMEELWPWADEWWKPSTPKRALEKAGALIAAEWDRLDRAERQQAEGQQP